MYVASGGVLPEQAPWLTDYIQELISLPTGKFDDRVDSTTQALAWLQETMNEPGFLVYMRRDIEQRTAEGRLDPSALDRLYTGGSN